MKKRNHRYGKTPKRQTHGALPFGKEKSNIVIRREYARSGRPLLHGLLAG